MIKQKEGAGVNPAPSNCSMLKPIRFKEFNKKEGAG